jgi:hypothetical protein
VLYVSSMSDMGIDYGSAMKKHIERLYQVVEMV